MQYKLKNKSTNEEVLCTKVVVDSFDYYVSDDVIKFDDYYISLEKNYATDPKERYVLYTLISKLNGKNPKKVVCCNNPSIDIGQVIDEVEMMGWDVVNNEASFEDTNGKLIDVTAFYEGYYTHAETHTLSDDEVVEFLEWKDNNHFSLFLDEWGSTLPFYSGCAYTSKELLQLFKEQLPKTIYYE